MKKLALAAAAAAASLLAPVHALAQETIVVTGSRQDRSATNACFSPNSGPSAIGVTRQADCFVTPLFVSSDSRDSEMRIGELFGSAYGVEIIGLEGDLYWQQASETEVFLYIEHEFVIRPR